MADPWDALGFVLEEPLHPGGIEATDDLLDRAGVGRETRLIDVGCGAGEALSLARERGARAVGIDHRVRGDGIVRGDLAHLPVRDSSVDVVLAECSICLSPDLSRSLAEAERVLDAGGRLALSDVVVEGRPPDVPDPIASAFCLTGSREREEVLARLERAGFEVGDVRDHRGHLLSMRDRVADCVDYEGLLGVFGERGERLLSGIERLESAVESGRVGYVSLVATRGG